MTALPADAAAFLERWLGESWSAEPLYGDASARNYFRVTTAAGCPYMLAWYPPEVREDLVRFLSAYRLISPYARVPQVIEHCDLGVGQADVGDATLFRLLHEDREKALPLYHAAIDMLIAFQRSPSEAGTINPPFDRTKFMQELMMTEEFYVRQLCGAGDEAGEERVRLYEDICARILAHPYVLCHRDFHGINLHIFNDSLYMIDYQDLRMGPDTYDVASLLRDRGVARILGPEAERELLEYYRDRVGAGKDLHHRYLETLLQRSLKILGTFAMQAVTRGRRHYLQWVEPTIESIRFCLEGLPEFRPLLDVFPLSPPMG